MEGTKHIPNDSCSTYHYGTMLSTVVLIKRDGEVIFVERDIWGLDSTGEPTRLSDNSKDRVFRFNIQPVRG